MSGGFFRGTSADQDTRFSNKHAKLMKSQKFASELEHLVDMSKVKMDVLKPWIATRVTEFLGFEDEVLINFIYGLLEGKVVNGKEVQIQLTGFMEKNTGKFMRELWTLLMSAEKNATGVPQQFLDAKEEETRKKKAEADQIANELKKRKDNEAKEFEQEKLRKMDGADKSKVINAAMDSNSKSTRRRASSADRDDESQRDDRNGFRREKSISKSPARRSPRGKTHSRSMSKSPSQSRSPSSRSRSLSKSPLPRGRPISSGKINRSPQRRSVTPRRRHSPRGSISPSRRKPSHYIRRSRSPPYRRSVTPVRRRIRSPLQRRSPNAPRQRSSSPTRRRSPPALRQISPSSPRRRSPPLRSRSPIRRRFRSPMRRRSPSPESRSPVRRRSPYPVRRRSPSPVRRRSRSPVRRRSPYPESRSPVRRRSPYPVRRRSRSPVRRRSRSPVWRRSRSPVRRRSPSPVRRRQRGSPSTSPRGSPLVRHKSSIAGSRRSPIPSRDRSPSPYGRSSSVSPTGRRSPSPVRRKFPEDPRRSPARSPIERTRAPVQKREGLNSVAAQPPSSFRSPQRDARDLSDSRKRAPSWSPSPDRPQTLSESSPGTRKRIVGKDRNPYESPVRQAIPPPKAKEHKSLVESPKTSGPKEGTKYVRVDSDHKSRSYQKKAPPSSVVGSKEAPSLAQIKEAPERSGSHQTIESGGAVDLRKRNRDSKSENTSGKIGYPEVTDKQRSPQINKRSHLGDKNGSDEKIRSNSNNIKADVRQDKPKPVSNNQIGSFDSGSEDSDKDKYDVSEKRKHKKSGRHEKDSNDDKSSDSQVEDRKEAKRRRKEEKRARKEERRRRHEEKRQRKREERRLEKLKTKKNLNLASDVQEIKEDNYSSDDKHAERVKRGSSEDEGEEIEKKRLEIELRRKAIESLQAKKGIRR